MRDITGLPGKGARATGYVTIDYTDPVTGKIKEQIKSNNHVFIEQFATSAWYDILNLTASDTLFITDSREPVDEGFQYLRGNILGWGRNGGDAGGYCGQYSFADSYNRQYLTDYKGVSWKYVYDFSPAQIAADIGSIGITTQYMNFYSTAHVPNYPIRRYPYVVEANHYVYKGLIGYRIDNTGIITEYNPLTNEKRTIDVSGVTGTASTLCIGFNCEDSRAYVYAYSSTAANRKVYEFLDENFTAVLQTYNASAISTYPSTTKIFAVYNGCFYYWNSGWYRADFANNINSVIMTMPTCPYNTALLSGNVGSIMIQNGYAYVFYDYYNTATGYRTTILDLKNESHTASIGSCTRNASSLYHLLKAYVVKTNPAHMTGGLIIGLPWYYSSHRQYTFRSDTYSDITWSLVGDLDSQDIEIDSDTGFLTVRKISSYFIICATAHKPTYAEFFLQMNGFGTSKYSGQELIPDISGEADSTEPNFFIIARSYYSDLPTMTVGLSEDETGDTFLRDTHEVALTLKIELITVNGKYYYRFASWEGNVYTVDDLYGTSEKEIVAYPRSESAGEDIIMPYNDGRYYREYSPVTYSNGGKIQHVVIYSSRRSSEKDVSMLFVVILNRTGVPVNHVITGDDRTIPRIAMWKLTPPLMPISYVSISGVDAIHAIQGISIKNRYSASSCDEMGNGIQDNLIWSLKETYKGVSIDNADGTLTVEDSAKDTDVVIIASSAKNPAVSAEYTVKVYAAETYEGMERDFSFIIEGDSYALKYLNSEGLDFTVDWGDGTGTVIRSKKGEILSPSISAHRYPVNGERTIRIRRYVSGHLNFTSDVQLKKVLTPFPTNAARTSFADGFSGCTNLTGIPPDLFINLGFITSFSYAFYRCRNLERIPEGLFDGQWNVTNFEYCFNDCEKLTELPMGLFRDCPNVTTFERTFYNCIFLTELPELLFAGCPNVTTFAYCFYGNSSITVLPENLFANNASVTNFYYCFANCQNITGININLHPDVLARNTNYSYMFYVSNTSYSHTGTAPDLWNSGTTSSNYKTQCFRNNTALTNYADIPSAWK